MKYMKLNEAIKALKLSPDDEVYIHVYQKVDYSNGLIQVKDLDKKTLKRETLCVQPNHGGYENGYCHYQFTIK